MTERPTPWARRAATALVLGAALIGVALWTPLMLAWTAVAAVMGQHRSARHPHRP